MSDGKTPAILVLIVRSRSFNWFVAAIDHGGQAQPLLRSEPGNLRKYVGMEPDDQLSFLRHRLSGALQQAFDRLWAKDWKASHVVLLTEDELLDGSANLTQRLADHFHVWLTRPPVTCFRAPQQWAADDPPRLDRLERLAGALEADQATALQTGLARVVEAMDHGELWEAASKPKV